MADSVYISENLTHQQLEFIKRLNEYEIEIFHLDKIEDQIHCDFANLNEILENLVHKGLLSRIEKGKFCLANFRNEKAIGTFIVKDSAIAYWTALNAHGLTEQFSNTLFIQTTHVKKDKTIFGTAYKFIKIAKEKRTGIIKEGYGSNAYYITDIEKTIIDCFVLPQYSGGYAELLRAFQQAKLSSKKMINYCTAMNNITAIKRMGYLAELLDKNGLKGFVKYAKEKVNAKYNLFNPQGSDKGEFISEWRLRLNITKEEILDITNKQY